ncbi:MAG TPA: hypothetical protein PKY77_08255 [Phycisphaerae bacterium]|nr:hypothetical protein [Phycisphaerae bacterium]HRY68684.1 hypothetical protein [Phycisphaerae bacterium]HSA25510.1 hypothetical protein [Phycisphaerae bacterium]
MNEALVKSLREAGKLTEPLRSPDGTEVLVLQHGGRVLGLFAPNSGENFFWTHDALKTPASAKAFYASNEWHNSGGDRTWLAPELDLFFPDYPSLERYFQPRQLDPGNYQVTRTAEGVRLVNQLTVTLARSRKTVELEMGKSLSWAPNPLRCEPAAASLLELEYAGYTQHTSLAITGPPVGRVGAWNLIQMPHGGDLLVPVHARTQPKIYFGSVSPEDLIAGDRMVRYRMRTHDCHKIGIRAVAATGRVGYLYQTGGRFALVVRSFFVNPSGDYVDVPWTDRDDLGYAVQSCNVVHESLGAFSELEYHIPAIGEGTGRTRCDDWSAVWAFRGPSEQVHAVARILLSPEV